MTTCASRGANQAPNTNGAVHFIHLQEIFIHAFDVGGFVLVI